MEWVKETKPIFEEVSGETQIHMGHDTHYDAMNFVYSKVVGNQMQRLDFQPMENHSFIVTKYIDTFPFFPRLFKLLHNVIPMFPYCAKIKFEQIGVLATELKGDELKKQILEYVKNAL